MIKDVEVVDVRHKRALGMSIADIARQTGYTEKTIRKWLKADHPPRYRRRVRRPSKLDPYKDHIMQRMADGVFNCELLYREITEQGYVGGKTILKDFVQPFRQQFRHEAVRRFETPPGEQLQVDWGYLGTFMLDGRPRKVWVLVGVLGYSRYLTAHCTTSMDLESLLLCHQRCFEALGGVPRQVVYDNMKTISLGRDLEHRLRWQPRFMDFALYYGFQPVLCRPHHPRSKGKVEAAIGYLKKNFCPGRSFRDLTDLNAQLSAWLQAVANTRIHATTHARPVDRWMDEPLQALPIRPFPTMVRFARRVSRDGYLSYQGVLYSVPWPFAGSTLMVSEALNGRLSFWWHGECVAEHLMPRDGRRRVTNPAHHAGLPTAQRRGQATGLHQVYPEVEQRPLAVYDAFAVAAR